MGLALLVFLEPAAHRGAETDGTSRVGHAGHASARPGAAMRRYDLLTFGESLIRLSTRNYERLDQAQSLDFRHGGAEANVAVGLARLGFKTAWVSRLANNALGRKIANDLETKGVDVSHVLWTDHGRVGLFFLEVGTGPRASTVVYDRRDSAMSHMTLEQFPWHVLSETRWLHVTGITVALSESCRQLVGEAMKRAPELGVVVSFDVNYRARLWTAEQARQTLEPLCQDVDVLFVRQSDAARVFGASGASPEDIIRELARRFARRVVVMTLGAQGSIALDKSVGASEVHHAPSIPVQHVVDRVGAGDAFAAGFIAGYLEDGIAKGLAFGNAMGALKMTIPGDAALVSRQEVEELVAGAAGGISR